MLINLDCAIKVGKDSKNKQTKARHITGTLQFIAIQILKGGLDLKTISIKHTYQHNLKSFFYIFLLVCIRYG